MKRPWRRHGGPPGDTGGRAARERAERALEDVRRRRAEQQGLRMWLRGEEGENHFGRDVDAIFRGGNA